jgi:choline-sulfatase
VAQRRAAFYHLRKMTTERSARPSRRAFLAAGASTALARPARAAAARPNILYIMTDQQHAGMMSCAGNRWVKTPAMDSLAAAGMRFELAYSSNPVCMPARTSMVTGRYPSHFGMNANGPAPRPPRDLTQAMGNVFRAAGYRTAFGGKTHWPRPMTAQGVGFDYITADERDDLATECERFLKQKHDQPFLLVASFINPHDICYMAIDAFTKGSQAPAMYPKSVVERERLADALTLPKGVSRQEFYARLCPPLPSNHRATAGEPGAFAAFQSFRGWVRKNWGADEWRLHRWAYCRLTERVDREIGRVLAALRGAGLERDTVVVFSSDHGDMDSAHGFEHKSLPYEEAARVPLLVSWPGRVPAGKVDRKHLVSSSVDLLPTLCDFAGIAPPKGLPGRSVRAIAQGAPPKDWRDDVAIEFTGGRSVRTARYKYALWEGVGPRELLIDMEKDPGEMKNLAADPSMAAVLADHRRRLRARIDELDDEWGRALVKDLA